MKNSFLIILSLLFFSCNKKTNNLAKIEINKVQNFGDIKVGDTVRKIFHIKNLSENSLIIKD